MRQHRCDVTALTLLPQECTWSRRCQTGRGKRCRRPLCQWWTSGGQKPGLISKCSPFGVRRVLWAFRRNVSAFSASHLWGRAYLSYTHLVGGEGTSLVRADDWSAAQSLHRGQTPDYGIFLGHTTGSQSQAGGDDSGQACDRWGRGLGKEPPDEKYSHYKDDIWHTDKY